MKPWAADAKFRFPFLFDGTQDVARAFRAACTPDFFLFDAARTLVYRGRTSSRLAASAPQQASPMFCEMHTPWSQASRCRNQLRWVSQSPRGSGCP